MDSHFFSGLLDLNDHGPSNPQIHFTSHYPRPPTPRMSSNPPLRSLKHSRPVPMLKPRNITPPEEKSTQVTESSTSSEAAQPQYEQTLARVKELEKQCPERPVSFMLSCKDFFRLTEDLGYGESNRRYSGFL